MGGSRLSLPAAVGLVVVALAILAGVVWYYARRHAGPPSGEGIGLGGVPTVTSPVQPGGALLGEPPGSPPGQER